MKKNHYLLVFLIVAAFTFFGIKNKIEAQSINKDGKLYYIPDSCPQGLVTNYNYCIEIITGLNHWACSNSDVITACTCEPSYVNPNTPVCGSDCTNNSQCPLECPVCIRTGSNSQSVNFANTNGTCQTSPVISPTSTPTIPVSTLTPTTPPGFCNEPCQTNSECMLAPDGCTTCVTSNNGQKTCQVPPVNTPTPTKTLTPSPTIPIPACNTPCNNPSACLGAQDGCTFCSPTTNKCIEPPSTLTPTIPIPACNTPCNNPSACLGAQDGCTFCSPTTNKCEVPPSGTPPATKTPTTTPIPFDVNKCKCDGISTTALAAGSPFSVTGGLKVEGEDVNLAKVTGMKFRLFEGNTLKQESGYLPVNTVLNTSTLVRYQSIWNSTLPSNLKKNVDYRLQVVAQCVPKTQNQRISSDEDYLTSEKISSPNIFSNISDFLSWIFALFKPSSSRIAENDTLQLQTFTPAEIQESTCSFIKFSFK